jgi:hypothetical protein
VKMAAMPGRDTKTKYQGVYARHQQACRTTATGNAKACDCTPRYYGVVWDRAASKTRKTRRFGRVGEARNARHDLVEALADGKLPSASRGPQLEDARDKFLEAARSGVALNKWGRRYRRRLDRAGTSERGKGLSPAPRQPLRDACARRRSTACAEAVGGQSS